MAGINRRKAIMAGAAATLALGCEKITPEESSPHAAHSTKGCAGLDDVWGKEFLRQWSPPDNLERDLTPGTSPIRLSCTSYRFDPKDPMGSVKRAKEAGYTAMEASGNIARGDYSDTQLNEWKEILKANDIEFYALHVWANIIDPDLEKRRANIELHTRACELAERMDMKFILTHTGGRGVRKDDPHKENFTRETWEMSVAALKEIIANTAGSPVALALEAVNTCNNNNPETHIQMKNDVGNDRIKVTLDPTNMLFSGNFFRTTELINKCFDLFGEDIMYAHAKDKIWDEMMPHFERAPLGEGSMDFETFLARLSRLKYQRAFLIEHLPAELYPQSKAHLEECAQKIGATIYQHA